MLALHGIVWFICLLLSTFAVFQTIGMAGMVSFFPEGRRWWQFPVQLLSLTCFAFVVLYHPFGTAP